ncbi:hypothetical protein U91I_01526 [alpha proteobacterium U9-1i]|nr:hypothetical protein U91I_01526 [alpha proteobacterium U9-1i]
MRALFALASLTALALAPAAHAAPVSVAPVALSAEYQTKVDDEIGARDSQVLADFVTRTVSRQLTQRGASIADGAPVRVEITIVDADPNRPTWEEMRRTPGLSEFWSVSTGGAELSATLRGADGRVLGEVSHRYFSNSLADIVGSPDTWSDANRATYRFARKVADAYTANAR